MKSLSTVDNIFIPVLLMSSTVTIAGVPFASSRIKLNVSAILSGVPGSTVTNFLISPENISGASSCLICCTLASSAKVKSLMKYLRLLIVYSDIYPSSGIVRISRSWSPSWIFTFFSESLKAFFESLRVLPSSRHCST